MPGDQSAYVRFAVFQVFADEDIKGGGIFVFKAQRHRTRNHRGNVRQCVEAYRGGSDVGTGQGGGRILQRRAADGAHIGNVRGFHAGVGNDVQRIVSPFVKRVYNGRHHIDKGGVVPAFAVDLPQKSAADTARAEMYRLTLQQYLLQSLRWFMGNRMER